MSDGRSVVAVVVENKNADRRGQIVVRAPLLNFAHELTCRDAASIGDLYKRIPEFIFETDARLPATEGNRALSNGEGSHGRTAACLPLAIPDFHAATHLAAIDQVVRL